jgi:hypothetical protein
MAQVRGIMFIMFGIFAAFFDAFWQATGPSGT